MIVGEVSSVVSISDGHRGAPLRNQCPVAIKTAQLAPDAADDATPGGRSEPIVESLRRAPTVGNTLSLDPDGPAAPPLGRSGPPPLSFAGSDSRRTRLFPLSSLFRFLRVISFFVRRPCAQLLFLICLLLCPPIVPVATG